jgi:hypothetical protein
VLAKRGLHGGQREGSSALLGLRLHEAELAVKPLKRVADLSDFRPAVDCQILSRR